MKFLRDMTEPELRNLMNALANDIRDILGPASHFTLLVFDDPEIAQYVSSCDRQTMIAALRKAADRLEKKQYISR